MKIKVTRPVIALYLSAFAICCFSITKSKGQQPKLDSLRAALRSAKQDTARINLLNEIAWQSRRLNPQDALVSAQQALSEGQKVNYFKGIGYSYTLIGTANMVLNKFGEAEINLLKGISVSDKAGDKAKLALAYHMLGVLMNFQAKYEESLKNYRNALSIRTEINDKQGIADIYFNMGIDHSLIGDYPAALKMYDNCLVITQETHDSTRLADVYNSIGFINQNQGDYPAALNNYLTSLKIKEKISCPEASIAGTKGNIGIIYYKSHDYEASLKYAYDALKTQKKIDDKRGMALSYQNIGNVLDEQGKLEDALENQTASLKIKEDLSDPAGMAGSYECMGVVYEHMKNYPKALSSNLSALKLFTSINDRNGIAQAIHNIGFLYLLRHDYDKAAIYLQEGLSRALEIGSRELTEQNYISLSELDSSRAAAAIGNDATKALYWKSAYSYYKQYTMAKDSLFNENKTKEITRQEIKYEQDKKDALAMVEQGRKDAVATAQIEKQKFIRNGIMVVAVVVVFAAVIGFLFYKRKRDAEQKQKETSLSLQVSETEMKALRSQMNPHFIFNALQSIQTFLMSHQPDDANMYLLKFSKLMRLVLENSQHGEVPLKDDMQALELYMQLESIRLTHPFTYQFHISKEIDVEETSIPPLILQPFVENAIWHGLQYKHEPGHIDIYISKKDNAMYATVEDNGVGRDLSRKAAQPAFIKKESLGMKLTEERLNILNKLKNIKAHFTITDLFSKNNQPTGTKVELALPMAE